MMDDGGFVNVNHIHPFQSELILVVKGAVRCALDDRFHRDLRAGQVITVPAGVSHGLVNLDNSTVMRVRYEPSLKDMDQFFSTLSYLAKRGHLNFLGFRGVPDPFHTFLIWRRFPGLMAFSWIPDPVLSLGAHVGGFMADLLGYKLRYD